MIMMPFARLPRPLHPLPALRRSFHSSTTSRASVLFALSSLSNSRETQHFNKLSRLSRVEHSPPLKLIQTSEIKPYPLPTPPAPRIQPAVRHIGGARSALRLWDDKALKIGRVLLADQARQTHRLRRALDRAKIREERQDTTMRRNKLAWEDERRKLRNDMRAAGMWILLSIGTATALATWRFWPQNEPITDSGELGRKLAARASHAMSLPPVTRRNAADASPIAMPNTVAMPVPEKIVAPAPVQQQQPAISIQPTSPHRWSLGELLWKLP